MEMTFPPLPLSLKNTPLDKKHPMNNDTLRYAGFWPRLASLLLDVIILSPISVLTYWGYDNFRLFKLYYFLPGLLLGLFYCIYLVRRYGGTPGKLIMGIRIRKLDGSPVGYKEAILRYFPDAVFGVFLSLALIYSLLHMTDFEYLTLTRAARFKRIAELAPSWYKPLHWLSLAWGWGELIVLLTNSKRRALHDFIAGTVVVHTRSDKKHSRGTAVE
jgi:uncharacterized RDD family membrane protein YckC